MIETGIITALIAAVLWGSMVVPLKIAKNAEITWFQLAQSIGALAATIIIIPIAGLLYDTNLYGFSSGLIWAAGNILALKSIIKLGMARATPLFVGTSILLSSTWGIIYFQEPIMQLETALLGLTLLLLGIIIVNTTQVKRNKQYPKEGIILAITAGLLLGTQFVPMQMMGITIEKILFPMVLGITAGATIIFLVMSRHIHIKHLPHGLTSGGIFALGNYFGILTISTLGLTVGYSITQIAVLVAILWGIIYFKEMPETKNKTKIIIAATLILTGSYLLATSL